jgi:glutamate dehydrogenase (NADP+)
MMEDMLKHRGDTIDGKTAVVSGSGNVAQYTVEKLIELGAKPVTMSDSSGFIFDPAGIDEEKLAWIKDLKQQRRGRISEYAKEFSVEYHEGKRPWGVPCQLAFPCATQNEINREDAQSLLKNGCVGVSEGANMPSEQAAIDAFQDASILFSPSKAANAGGVAVSGLEMTQNSMRLSWSRDELNRHLREIMLDIHNRCVEHGAESDQYVNYLKGANIAGFIKVADAMLAYGVM